MVRTGRFVVGSALNRYRQVLRLPGAPRFFLAASLARLGVAMSPLAVLWAVRGATGSFGHAGAATGAFAIGDALIGPQVARLIDRFGQRRVVSITAALFLATVLALIYCSAADPALICCSAAGTRGWVQIVLAGAAGGSAPAAGALSAARWRQLVLDRDGRQTALALEATVNDVVFLLGPVLVTTLGATLAPWAGLAAVAVLISIGITALLTARDSEPPRRDHGPGLIMDRRLLHRPFLTLVVANLAMGLFFGGIPVTITAFSFAHRAGVLAGPILAVSSVASLLAGLLYGAIGPDRPVRVMIVASLILTVGLASLAWIPGVAWMFAGYGLIGACVAPILIPAAVVLQRVTDGAVYTQALTWMNSASAAGIAVAAPLTGQLIQLHGSAAGFWATAALTALLPVTLLVGRSALTPVPHCPDPVR